MIKKNFLGAVGVCIRRYVLYRGTKLRKIEIFYTYTDTHTCNVEDNGMISPKY